MMEYSETQATPMPSYAVRYREPSGPAHTIVWMLLAGLCGLLVFGGIVFAATSSELQQIRQSGPIPARYYLAFFDRDYARAYSYLDHAATIDGRHVNARSFATMATAADRREGRVLGFEVVPSHGDPSRVTLSVHRIFGNYAIHLRLRYDGMAERIVSVDSL